MNGIAFVKRARNFEGKREGKNERNNEMSEGEKAKRYTKERNRKDGETEQRKKERTWSAIFPSMKVIVSWTIR